MKSYLDDEEYTQLLEKARKIQELSSAACESFPECSENPNEIKSFANNLKSRAIELTEEQERLQSQLERTRGQLRGFVDIYEPKENEEPELADEEFNAIIEKAKRDRELSQAVQDSLPDHCSTGEEAANEIKQLQASTEKLKQQLRELASAIEGFEDPEIIDEDLTDSQVEEVITKAKQANHIIHVVDKLLLNSKRSNGKRKSHRKHRSNLNVDPSYSEESNDYLGSSFTDSSSNNLIPVSPSKHETAEPTTSILIEEEEEDRESNQPNSSSTITANINNNDNIINNDNNNNNNYNGNNNNASNNDNNGANLADGSTDNQEYVDDITYSNEVANKINYLKNRSAELDSANETVSSLNSEIDHLKQQLENRTNELVDTQKQLMSLYDIIEVIQGEPVNPEDLTPEMIQNLVSKAREDKELLEAVQSTLPESPPHNKASDDSASAHRSRSADYFRLIHQLEDFVSIYSPSDENNNKRLEELNDDEFARMIDTARKNKLMADAIRSSLPDSSSSPEEVEKRIKSLESRSNELDKVSNQFNQVLHAIDETDTKPEAREHNEKEILAENNTKTSLLNARDITNEQLSGIITKAKKSNEITSAVNRTLPENSSTGKEVEDTINDLKLRSVELDRISQAFDKVLEAIKPTKEHQEEAPITSRNISDQQLLEVVSDAKQANEITTVIHKTLPENSSTAQEVEDTVNTFKSRSNELDEVSQQLENQTSEFEKLRSQLRDIFDIYNNDNDNINNEYSNANINKDDLNELRDIKHDIVTNEDEILDEQISQLIDKVKRSKDITTVVETSFPDDSQNAQQVENKIKSLEERSTQLDDVFRKLESQTEELQRSRKQLEEVSKLLNVEGDENIGEMNEEEFTDFIERTKSQQEQQKQASGNKNQVQSRGVRIEEMKRTLDGFDRVVRQLDSFLQVFSGEGENAEELSEDEFTHILEKAKKESDIALAVKTTLPRHSSCGEEVKTTINILKLRSSELDKVRKQLADTLNELAKVRKQLNTIISTNAMMSISHFTNTNDNANTGFTGYSTSDSLDFLSNNDHLYI
ncbi:hypothetical protein M9Y10_006013 [Tritrichomonas musculus]|uniref:Uncharacterized protein n=1 Tax=Tritrichomonas musculus TaxID=1915356 RepID=A0ABR2JE82_9EUKA